jgi:hypothetical protein
MSRKIHKHPVEVLVDTYLIRQSKAKKIRVDQHMLDKAAKLIRIALRNPCCEPAEEVTYQTWQENWFIKALNALLINIDTRKWKASLERTQQKIENLLNKVCCFTQVQGFGGITNENGEMCQGESETFYVDVYPIALGTKIYESDRTTLVTTITLFRDDVTGIIYTVAAGIVTGVSGDSCVQVFQICNGDSGAEGFGIAGVTSDGDLLTLLAGTDFPILNEDCSQFRNGSASPGLRTVGVQVSGNGATQIDIVDSLLNLFSIPVSGPGLYTQSGVYISGPNMFTAGVGITLLP